MDDCLGVMLYKVCFFNIATLSGDVLISYTLVVILSVLVPELNSLLRITNSGITSSCVMFIPVVVSRIIFCVSSSSRSSQRQISSIFCISALRNVSLGLTPRKNPILACF